MAQLKRELKQKLKLNASSLIEVLVSSVIMLITFVISMDILVKLTTSKSDVREILQIEMDIREYISKEDISSEITTYQWGEIEVITTDMENDLIHIKYLITMAKNSKKIEFEKIIANENET